MSNARLDKSFAVTCLGLGLLAGIGSPLLAQETLLVTIGEDWKYTSGIGPYPEDWNQLDFDDSTWLFGPTGIGYGDNDDATQLTDMMNGYLSILTRKTFNVANPANLGALSLRVSYDDGLVAYINGTEIGRLNMPEGDVIETTPALGAIEPGAPAILDVPLSLLKAGVNILAVSVHNASLASSDLSFIPELVTNADVCPQTITCSFALGNGVTLNWSNLKPYDSILIRRNGEVLEPALDGSTQTYLDPLPPPGDTTYQVVATTGGKVCPELECAAFVIDPANIILAEGAEWLYFKGTISPPVGWNSVDFDDSTWLEGITGIGYGDNDDATILDDMQQIADDPLTVEDESRPGYLTVFTRIDLGVGDLTGLEALLLTVIYDDGLVVYFNGTEIGRVNMPVGDANELTPALAAIDPGAPMEFRIPANLVTPGKNVLAVSVHNANLTSSDLSFRPVVSRIGGGAPPLEKNFRRGDADDSAVVNLTDAVAILRTLFQGGDPPICFDAADADDSGTVNLTDAVFILRFLFQGGPAPPPPGITTCGEDVTKDDTLPKCASTRC